MSYSISNVFKAAGLANVQRWIPFHLDERKVRNRIKNKMIRPTTIPQTLDDLVFEQAVAREALRLAFVQHKSFATRLKGVQTARTISEAFEQEQAETIVNMMTLDMLIGSGGVLSHAPRRAQAALMLIDSFQPEGVTRLAVDSIFMMPQLGVLSVVHPKAATEVFEKDCLIHLGTCIAPAGQTNKKKPILGYRIEFPDGKVEEGELLYGEMKKFPLAVGEKAKAKLKPTRGFDLGRGSGEELNCEISGGVVGVILDGRGRPLVLPEDKDERVKKLVEWYRAIDIYPEKVYRMK